MPHFLEYESTKGMFYSLRPEQIRLYRGNAEETRIYASVAGEPITFTVLRPYSDVRQEINDKIKELEEMSI